MCALRMIGCMWLGILLINAPLPTLQIPKYMSRNVSRKVLVKYIGVKIKARYKETNQCITK
jgi:hypothetical protein